MAEKHDLLLHDHVKFKHLTQQEYITDILHPKLQSGEKQLQYNKKVDIKQIPCHPLSKSPKKNKNSKTHDNKLQAKINIISAKNKELSEKLRKRVNLLDVQPEDISILPDATLHRLHELIVEEKNQRRLCIVCLETGSRVVFLPCRHQKVCKYCSKDLSVCPYCQQPIQEKILPFS